MSKEQALLVISNALAQMKLSLQEHQVLLSAIEVLKKELGLGS